MKAKKLTSTTALDEQVRALYESAFPLEEQIPYGDLMILMDKMPLDFTAYYDDGEFVGFTIVYQRKTFNWFWYFAVRSGLRGKGLGQQILTMLIEEYKDCTNILDMESPDQGAAEAEVRLLLAERFSEDGGGEVVRGHRLYHPHKRRGDIHLAGL